MKKFTALLVLALIAGCNGSPPEDGAKNDATVQEGPISAEAANRVYTKETWKAEVLDSAGPVLVDFWAPWCGPCRAMEPTIQKLARDYKVVKVNADNNEGLAARYGVTGLPTFLIFRKGDVAARYVGFTSEGPLRESMRQFSGRK
jgi:thioredoxin 1